MRPEAFVVHGKSIDLAKWRMRAKRLWQNFYAKCSGAIDHDRIVVIVGTQVHFFPAPLKLYEISSKMIVVKAVIDQDH